MTGEKIAAVGADISVPRAQTTICRADADARNDRGHSHIPAPYNGTIWNDQVTKESIGCGRARDGHARRTWRGLTTARDPAPRGRLSDVGLGSRSTPVYSGTAIAHRDARNCATGSYGPKLSVR